MWDKQSHLQQLMLPKGASAALTRAAAAPASPNSMPNSSVRTDARTPEGKSTDGREFNK